MFSSPMHTISRNEFSNTRMLSELGWLYGLTLGRDHQERGACNRDSISISEYQMSVQDPQLVAWHRYQRQLSQQILHLL